jgi:hypothetical protein
VPLNNPRAFPAFAIDFLNPSEAQLTAMRNIFGCQVRVLCSAGLGTKSKPCVVEHWLATG